MIYSELIFDVFAIGRVCGSPKRNKIFTGKNKGLANFFEEVRANMIWYWKGIKKQKSYQNKKNNANNEIKASPLV